jgi:PAS domain S-box-containing protein
MQGAISDSVAAGGTAATFAGRRTSWRWLGEVMAVALAFYLGARLGRTVASPPGFTTVFWPPSGIAIAALLILGQRVWPGVLLGAALSTNWSGIDFSSSISVFRVLAIGGSIDAGAVLQAVLGAALLRGVLREQNPLERFSEAMKFCGVALAVSLVGATVGISSLWLGGELTNAEVVDRWMTWWVGDACGILVAMPAILIWRRVRIPEWPLKRWFEAIALLIALIVVSTMIFLKWQPSDARYPADLFVLPLVAWVAYRFSQREVTLGIIIVLAVALWGTVHGHGPYGGPTPWSNLPAMQAFIGILSVSAISMGAAVAERNAVTVALQTSERWLRECQRISHIGSYVFDIKGNSWTSSETLDEIFGIGPDYPHTLEGWSALLHPDDRKEVLRHVTSPEIETRQSIALECRIVRPNDGKVRWMLCQGVLTLDAKGSPIRLAGTVLDFTERRNMEAQLQQARKMESVGRLAGGVAHDFNNLLTVINGYGDLVLGGLPPAEATYQQVKEMRRAGERAADLTRQLLAFSRKQMLQPKVMNLNVAVRDSENMLRRLLGEDIELVYALEPELWPVAADPGQINQVIINLAINARDAMPAGGRLIFQTSNCVMPSTEEDLPEDRIPRDCACLIVRDTGHGMDSETLEHVFEPFFTTKDMGQGTGLGLATVYGIVEQSGGHISVQSERGRGAAFTIYLPAIRAKQELVLIKEAVPKGNETVLVVEDEEGVRLLIVRILQSHGYEVLQARGGDEAIRLFNERSGRIDLLITDVVMPQMKGPELAAHLKGLHEGMKVLFISGYTDPQITNVAELNSGSYYLQKPFERDALTRAVRDALR